MAGTAQICTIQHTILYTPTLQKLTLVQTGLQTPYITSNWSRF